MTNMNILKDNVGKMAADLIEDGQIVGLGTGSTTHYFIKYLGERIKNEELNILGIPTSYQSLIIARDAGINTTTLDEYDIDIAVDGADEVNRNLDLIKGGGAAHTLEKLVDSSAKEFVVIVDQSKMSDELGSFPVPIEIIPDALRIVKNTLIEMGGKPELRMGMKKDGPVVTDNGNFILDTKFDTINNPHQLEKELNTIPGVLENGIFSGLADKVIVGKMSHIDVIKREDII